MALFSLKWSKTGSQWRSLDGLVNHLKWINKTTPYYRNQFRKKENQPVIVEFKTVETKQLTLDGKECLKDYTLPEIEETTEDLEDI